MRFENVIEKRVSISVMGRAKIKKFSKIGRTVNMLGTYAVGEDTRLCSGRFK